MPVGEFTMFEIAPLPEGKEEGYKWANRIALFSMPYTSGGSWKIGRWGKVDEAMKSREEDWGYPYLGCPEEISEDEAMAFFDDRGLPRPFKGELQYDPQDYIPLRKEEGEPWRSDFFGELAPAQAREIWEKLGLEWQGDDWVMPSSYRVISGSEAVRPRTLPSLLCHSVRAILRPASEIRRIGSLHMSLTL
ncbi:MAG: hypothetical protein IKQ60_01785 [Candidatus Methanomethylophilaceae archaeon]|nr:hypothetical protein [Candidatus Methanomethylophilaceae archaeon]